MSLTEGKKIYFASDFHLGSPDAVSSLKREKKVVRWLDEIKKDAQEIYLIGDVFDFWFEYKHVIPRGYTRLLGKMAEIADSGIKIHVFTGNHDMWIFDYLPKEIGVDLYREPISRTVNGKHFYIGHGDGLGPGDRGYKFIKRVFANRLCQWLFKWLHPDLGIGMGFFWSRISRNSGEMEEVKYLGEDKEWLIIYAKEILRKQDVDYFVFGHRHIPLDIKISEETTYFNLGDWITHFTYAEFDGKDMILKKYEN
ncbi:MAG TPA: UDP-2,3-diacylglucosamine hydrolase [Flavobacteriales bacterium]|nr:UDP-2,3-diacylglucosamine hydrolase [Flavobacteriales bacterium]